MTRAPKYFVRIVAVFTSLTPALASAHPGLGEHGSFVAGALHPLAGVDHVAGFLIVGILAAKLGGRTALSMTAVLLGLLVAAWTTDSEGWQYAAGFMLSGAGLIAAATTATRLVVPAITAAARRSPI